MRKAILSALLALILIISACNGDDDSSNDNQRIFNWDESADTILFRIDEISEADSDIKITNSVPLCTIWGDGRTVWVNDVYDTTEVLEAKLSDEQIRRFLQDVIGYGFYSWEENIIPPTDEAPLLQSITLNLYTNPRTVERYGDWPNNSFVRILELCQSQADTRALFIPDGGWVQAYEIAFNNEDKQQAWPRNAPFTMAELAASETPRWVEGTWAAELWTYTREVNVLQVLERGEAYAVTMQVPGVSRTSPPPPTEQ